MPIPVWSSHSVWYDKELRLALYSNWEALLKCMKMLKSAATRLTVCTSIIYIIYNKSFRKWLPLHIWSHQVKSSTTKICKLQISKTSPTHMITKYSIEVGEREKKNCTAFTFTITITAFLTTLEAYRKINSEVSEITCLFGIITLQMALRNVGNFHFL